MQHTSHRTSLGAPPTCVLRPIARLENNLEFAETLALVTAGTIGIGATAQGREVAGPTALVFNHGLK